MIIEKITCENVKSKKFKRLETINARVAAAMADPTIATEFTITDNSVQAELRLKSTISINLPVDSIHYPKNLKKNNSPTWAENQKICFEIRVMRDIASIDVYHDDKINIKTKSGAAKRADAKKNFCIEQGNIFLGAYAQAKKQIPARLKKIKKLQTQQRTLIKKMRAENATYLSEKRLEKEWIARQNENALKTGRFWDATRDALKNYFHPPFSKNYLADLSKRWRAALFLECESISYKYGKNWRHKLGGTGRGYLCGIDDNGDEWGHEISECYGNLDQYGNFDFSVSVEEAMAVLFGIETRKLADCERQGDILFCRIEEIPDDTELHEQLDPWIIRESHTVSSRGLKRNGRYFKSEKEITITHASHRSVTLPAGSYQLYELQIAAAD